MEARALIRVEEFSESVSLIRQPLEGMPEGALAVEVGPLQAWKSAFGMVEGWRGEIVHWITADSGGRLYQQRPAFVSCNRWLSSRAYGVDGKLT